MGKKKLATIIVSLYTLILQFWRWLILLAATYIPEPVLQFIPMRKFNQSDMSETYNANDCFYLKDAYAFDGQGIVYEITGLLMFLYQHGYCNGPYVADIIKKKYSFTDFTVTMRLSCALLDGDGYYKLTKKTCETKFTDGISTNDFGLFPVFD